MYNHTTFSAHCICVEIWLELSISSNNSSSFCKHSFNRSPSPDLLNWRILIRGFISAHNIQFRIRMPNAYMSSRLSRESALGGTKRILQENFSPFTFCGERKGEQRGESHSNSFWQEKKLFSSTQNEPIQFMHVFEYISQGFPLFYVCAPLIVYKGIGCIVV